MSKEFKIFVGGLTVQTTELDLEEYFSSFGNISHVAIIKNKQTGLSKSYAFVYTHDERTYKRIISNKHSLKGRIIDCKDGFNKEENPALFKKLNSKKIFVGGLAVNTQDHHLADYFSKFGEVFKAYVIIDPKTKRSKRFGFIIMEHEESVQKVMAQSKHPVNGSIINCKRFDRMNVEKSKKPDSIPKTVLPSSNESTVHCEINPITEDKGLEARPSCRSILDTDLVRQDGKSLLRFTPGDSTVSPLACYLRKNFQLSEREQPKDEVNLRFNLCLKSRLWPRLDPQGRTEAEEIRLPAANSYRLF